MSTTRSSEKKNSSDTPAKVGRPRLDDPKKDISIRIDSEVVDWLKAGGSGWQTRLNDILVAAMKKDKSIPALLEDDSNDDQIVYDAAHVGKAMLRACRELSEKQGRPLYLYGQVAIQALLVGHGVITEDDPLNKSLRDLL